MQGRSIEVYLGGDASLDQDSSKIPFLTRCVPAYLTVQLYIAMRMLMRQSPS